MNPELPADDQGTVTHTVDVRIAGTGNTVTVVVKDGSTVADTLRAALTQLDRPSEAADKLAPLVNGEDADLTDKVKDGDVVAAAPPVANG